MTEKDRFFECYEYLKKSGKVTSQEQFGQVIGTDKAGVSDIKAGRKKVTIEHLKRMKISYPEISLDYVIVKQGDLLVKNIVTVQPNLEMSELYKEIISLQKKVIELTHKQAHNKEYKSAADGNIRDVERELKS